MMRHALLSRRRGGALLSRRVGLSVAFVLVGLLLTLPSSLAVPADGIDIPQPTRVERFNPDQQVCQPQTIKASFASHLQPWADQPPAVLQQLRRVQLEMTRATVQRCVSKGLLQPAEASALERQLGLQDPPAPTQGTGAATEAAPAVRP
jgi:hypothetical protein